MDAFDFRRELGLLGMSSIDNYTIDLITGKVEPAEGRGREVMRAIASVKHEVSTRMTGKGENREAETTYRLEIKFWDKVGTLRLVGQTLGVLHEEAPKDPDERPIQMIVYLDGKPVAAGQGRAKLLAPPSAEK